MKIYISIQVDKKTILLSESECGNKLCRPREKMRYI